MQMTTHVLWLTMPYDLGHAALVAGVVALPRGILHRAIVKQRDKPKKVCRKVTGSMKPFVSLYRWHITAAAIQLDLRKTMSLPAVIDVLEA